MTDWQTNYQRRVNAERLTRQAEPVQKTAKEILEQLKTIEQALYWALDDDAPAYWPTSLIEHAHALVDLGHAYRAAIVANPPPPEESDDEEDVAPPIDPMTGRPANYRKTDGTWVTIAEGD